MITLVEWAAYREYVNSENNRISERNGSLVAEYLKREEKMNWWQRGFAFERFPIFHESFIEPTIEGCLDYLLEKTKA